MESIKRIFAFCITGLVFFSCSYPIPKQDILEKDTQFLSIPGSDQNHCNEVSIQLSRTAKLDLAEISWDECIEKFTNEKIVHLNRLRFYFLLEEYEYFKGKIVKQSPSKNSIVYQSILEELLKTNRVEERVVLLDGLSRIKGWELFAYEELAFYYLQLGNFGFAENYFNLILEVNSFHENALYGMMDIQIRKEKWNSVLDYAKSIKLSATKNKDYHYYFLKANYELGRYEEALKWAESASSNEKSEIQFLEVWRDVLLVLYDDPNWNKLLPYYRKAVERGYAVPESVFFPTLDARGKEERKNLRSGR